MSDGLASISPSNRELRFAALVILEAISFTALNCVFKVMQAGQATTTALFYVSAASAIMLVLLRGRNSHGQLLAGGLLELWPHIALLLLLGYISTLFWFQSLAYLPISTAQSLSFSKIVFITVLAMILAKEPLSFRQIATLSIGCTGVIIIYNPQAGGEATGVALVLLSSLASASMPFLTLRLMQRCTRPDVVLLVTMSCAVGSLPSAMLFSPSITWSFIILSMLGAILFVLSQLLRTQIYETTSMHTVATLEFVRLVPSITMDLFAFHVAPTIPFAIGSVFLCASVVIRFLPNVSFGAFLDWWRSEGDRGWLNVSSVSKKGRIEHD
jgi:drug/metabolite transporter (DMT)-like permease